MSAPTRVEHEEGFALALIVTLVMIMFIMLAAMMLPLTYDVTSAQRTRNVVSERQMGESVLNELFSQAAKASDLRDSFRMVGRVDPGLNVDSAGSIAGWGEYDNATGQFGTCQGLTHACYYYSPQITANSPFVNVEVTTRQGCNAAGNNCVVRRFQQQWRRRSFVDYLVFTDVETLQPALYGTGASSLKVVRNGVVTTHDSDWANLHCGLRTDGGQIRDGLTDNSRRQTTPPGATQPADYDPTHFLWPHRVGNDPNGVADEQALIEPTDRRQEDCFEVAYTGATSVDKVNGPIHTNDYWYWYCGTPKFAGSVEATGDPATAMFAGLAIDAIFHRSTSAGCTSAASIDAATTNASRGKFLKLPDNIDPVIAGKLAALTLAPASGTTVKVTLLPGGKTMLVDTAAVGGPVTMNVPYRGLVYVTGNLEISGESNDVTFMTAGDLTVTGDIRQPSSIHGVTLGFVAGGSTTIKQDATGADRTVVGAFLSLTGGMSVDGWKDATLIAPNTKLPTIHLTGAVIAKYRPVFGTYNAAGELQTGVYKDLQYPKDSDGHQIPPSPPYFLEPVNAVWVRLDLSETPIQAGKPGLTPRPVSGTVAPSAANISCANTRTWPPADAADPTRPSAYSPACLTTTTVP